VPDKGRGVETRSPPISLRELGGGARAREFGEGQRPSTASKTASAQLLAIIAISRGPANLPIM
jgi:hypothetical protein